MQLLKMHSITSLFFVFWVGGGIKHEQLPWTGLCNCGYRNFFLMNYKRAIKIGSMFNESHPKEPSCGLSQNPLQNDPS